VDEGGGERKRGERGRRSVEKEREGEQGEESVREWKRGMSE